MSTPHRPGAPSSVPQRSARPTAIVLAMSACVGIAGPWACSRAPAEDNKAPAATAPTNGPAPEKFATQASVAREVPQLVPVLGALASSRRTQLAANASGRVTTVQVERGARVVAGQVLLTLDVRAANNVAKEARANLQNLQAMQQVARGDCARTESLHKKGAISEQEYDRGMAACREADAQFEAAQARTQEAMRTLQDGQVRAPFAGIISERSVDVGDYVRQDSPVATLLVPDPLRLQCGVPERYAVHARPGTAIYFEVAAYPGREFCGEVKYVSGEVRTQTRDIVVEAEVHNGSGELMAGMFATAQLTVGTRTLPAVPASAVVAAGEEHVVYVVERNALRARVVRPGRRIGEEWVIESGLGVGETVVSSPKKDIVDGQKLP